MIRLESFLPILAYLNFLQLQCSSVEANHCKGNKEKPFPMLLLKFFLLVHHILVIQLIHRML